MAEKRRRELRTCFNFFLKRKSPLRTTHCTLPSTNCTTARQSAVELCLPAKSTQIFVWVHVVVSRFLARDASHVVSMTTCHSAFGLLIEMHRTVSGVTCATATGKVLGTPSYQQLANNASSSISQQGSRRDEDGVSSSRFLLNQNPYKIYKSHRALADTVHASGSEVVIWLLEMTSNSRRAQEHDLFRLLCCQHLIVICSCS